MKEYRKWLSITLFLIIIYLILIGMFNYVVDPHQFYRKASYLPLFTGNPYYQNPGLARNYDYDTVILGNSYSENFFPSHVNKSMGVKALRLTCGGSSIQEQSMIANVALRTKKVKNVIIGLAINNALREGKISYFPDYLYDNNPLNDYQYLLNVDVSMDSIRIIAEQLGLYHPYRCDFDLLGNWNANAILGSDAVLKPYKENKIPRIRIQEIEKSLVVLEKYFLPLVRQHPDVNFYIFYPPHSIVFFAYDIRNIETYLQTKKYIFIRLKPYKNVKIVSSLKSMVEG